MKKKIFKIIQQASLIGVACFLLWVALSRSIRLVTGMGEVDLGTHGHTALIITVVMGLAFGIGLAGAFFYLAHKQTEDE